LLVIAALLAIASPAAAQDDDVVALDVSWLGGELSYARSTGSSTSMGFSLGGAGWWVASEHFSGEHYDEGDLLGFAHGGGFWRRDLSERFVVEVGVQVGALFHGAVEGNAALALFGGPYVSPMFGWRNVKFGPRVHAVWVYEAADASALGVVVDPLVARLQLAF
jgi:hypothetical protein